MLVSVGRVCVVRADRLKAWRWYVEWAKEKGMNSFLSVAKGSVQPPRLVEMYVVL